MQLKIKKLIKLKLTRRSKEVKLGLDSDNFIQSSFRMKLSNNLLQCNNDPTSEKLYLNS